MSRKFRVGFRQYGHDVTAFFGTRGRSAAMSPTTLLQVGHRFRRALANIETPAGIAEKHDESNGGK